ncbi:PTS sugar transporter subunit IIB [Clostridium sp.]|uniref:PTS sugar transporter subunit IIB n=1 Tax=Clostridium sp. TaxID=1506 RepID=UPI001D3D3457|nr:PTS sugar transporter subunit IIB [Clostridium sp.]MBS5940111.1 PTS sugar transporter subunit IIB [Clostridium sp.]
MEIKRIFLCCGAGMSSGFLAQALRKAAKKKKVLVEVLATAEIDTLRQKAEENGVKMEIIPEDIYGEIDGEGLLDFVLEKLS